MEFAVNMTCDACKTAVLKSLTDVQGVEKVSIDVAKQQVIVEASAPSSVIQNAIESTGLLAVLRGQGHGKKQNAVSILKNESSKAFGVIRFVQSSDEKCLIDASLNGLNPASNYSLSLHEYGDISQGVQSTGDIYHPSNATSSTKAGDFGRLPTDENGVALKKFESNLIKVPDIIGRSMVLCENSKGIAFGIVARSAGMFENDKKICTCSGKTIWEERIESRNEMNQ